MRCVQDIIISTCNNIRNNMQEITDTCNNTYRAVTLEGGVTKKETLKEKKCSYYT